MFSSLNELLMWKETKAFAESVLFSDDWLNPVGVFCSLE